MKSCSFPFLSWNTFLITALLWLCGCGRSDVPAEPSQRVTLLQSSASAFSEADLGLIKMINPKAGGPESDPVVAKLLAAGTNAAPFLIEKIADDSPSQVYDVFQYYIGDIAHRLLCDIYLQDFLWPVANAVPIGGYSEVTFQDYMEFVHASGGRQKLQTLWQERLKTISAKPSN